MIKSQGLRWRRMRREVEARNVVWCDDLLAGSAGIYLCARQSGRSGFAASSQLIRHQGPIVPPISGSIGTYLTISADQPFSVLEI